MLTSFGRAGMWATCEKALLLVASAATTLSLGSEAGAAGKVTGRTAESAAGLVGLWHLDGNALDSSGSGHNGTIAGATVIANGVSGQAFHFNGSSGIDVGNLTFPGSSYTVNIWLRTTQPAATEDWRVPINKADSPPGGNQTFEIYLGDGRGTAGLNAPAYAVWLGGSTVVNDALAEGTNINGRNGKWHMATATYRSGEQNLYVDGCLAATAAYAGSLPLTANSVIIGGRDHFGPFHHSWIGDLDEVSIYTRALVSTEIEALYKLYRQSAGCGQVSDFTLTKAICYNLTSTQHVTGLIAGQYWNCAGLTTAPLDRLKVDVRGTTP
jgi:Concanavalin A-like lectin/glucanases superfamily